MNPGSSIHVANTCTGDVLLRAPGSFKLHVNAWITLPTLLFSRSLRVKNDVSKELLYLLFSCILLSPLLHVIRGLGDALGLHSSDTSFPSVAMTRTGFGINTGAEAAEDT